MSNYVLLIKLNNRIKGDYDYRQHNFIPYKRISEGNVQYIKIDITLLILRMICAIWLITVFFTFLVVLILTLIVAYSGMEINIISHLSMFTDQHENVSISLFILGVLLTILSAYILKF